MSKTLKLRNGVEMPIIGMGTWHHGPKAEIQDALKYVNKLLMFSLNSESGNDNRFAFRFRFAIRNGYRHIDCAHIYLNETEVGEVFNEMIGKEIKREELFIGTKVPSDLS